MSTTEIPTTEMSSTAEILGRADANDLDAILGMENPYRDEVIHAVKDNAAAIFTWDYEKGARPGLNKLYEKAKTSQWNGETDLDWSIEVDQEGMAASSVTDASGLITPDMLVGTCFTANALVLDALSDQRLDRACNTTRGWLTSMRAKLTT